jgi:hypothetical protein
MNDLLALAQDYVRVAAELSAIRRQMLVVLSNGADPAPAAKEASAMGPISARKLKPGPKPGQPRKLAGRPSDPRRAALAKAAEDELIALIRDRPMPLTTLAETMGAKRVTTADRLRRLEGRGAVERTAAGWRATPATAAPAG